jgi:pyruvate/2-oxoglutarate dehydrogenase complex dihydrolipoamide acyltransferase (E2) component
MKKWMYVIFPAAMLGIFLIFYFSAAKKAELKEQQRAAEVAKQKDDEAAKKRIAEDKARVDAAKRSAERLADEAKKDADKIAKWQGDSKRIQDDTDKSLADASRYQNEVSKSEIVLDTTRKAKDKASRDAFDLLKQVERAKVDRRSAEIEIQRLTEMVARKASESAMTRPVVSAASATP